MPKRKSKADEKTRQLGEVFKSKKIKTMDSTRGFEHIRDKGVFNEVRQKARVSIFFCVDGCERLTGLSQAEFLLYIVVECVNNSLDKKRVKEVKITIERVEIDGFEAVAISIEDDGEPCITGEDLRKIANFEYSPSSKRGFKVVSRGVLGEAVQRSFGISKALWRSNPPPYTVVVESMNTTYKINFKLSEKGVFPEITPKPGNFERTRFTFLLPVATYDYIAIWNGVRVIGALNPHVKIEYDDEVNDLHYSNVASEIIPIHRRARRKEIAGNIWCYNSDDFSSLVGEMKHMAVEAFVTLFSGVRHRTYGKKVIEIADINPGTKLEDLNPARIKILCEAIKKVSKKPSPRSLPIVGKEALFKELLWGWYAQPLKYVIKYGAYESGSRIIPFAIEAVAFKKILDLLEEEKIIECINFTVNLYRPFTQWAYRVKNKLVTLIDLIKGKRLSVLIHLVCPNIPWRDEVKGKMDIEPFKKTLLEVLNSVCHPERTSSGKGKSRARELLKEELERRIGLLKEQGEIPKHEWIPQQGLYYKIRNLMGGRMDIKRKSFTDIIRKECENLGYSRDELGIKAAARAELYFRGKVYSVGLEEIDTLARLGSDVVVIEKEGVCGVLSPYAKPKGVALLNPRGFAPEYAERLSKLAKKYGGNIFLITDYDASGLVMVKKLYWIPWIGVDLKMLQELRLIREVLEEKYDTKDGKAPRNHLKSLPPELRKEVEETRVEIDAVLAAVGPKRFWECIEKRMLEQAPVRDLTRSIKLTVPLPQEVSMGISRIKELVNSMGDTSRRSSEKMLKRWKEGLVDVETLEERLQDQMLEELEGNTNIQKLKEELRKFLKRLRFNASMST